MKALITLIYRPIGIIAGIVAGLVGKRIFKFVWGKIDEEEAPKPNTQLSPLAKIMAAAALQGLIFKLTRTVVDRGVARGVYNLTGWWPGEQLPGEK